MNKKTVENISKGGYIALMILAAAAIVASMILGPMGYDRPAIIAALCACVITVLILMRTVSAMRYVERRK